MDPLDTRIRLGRVATAVFTGRARRLCTAPWPRLLPPPSRPALRPRHNQNQSRSIASFQCQVDAYTFFNRVYV